MKDGESLDYLLSPDCVRDGARAVLEATKKGQGRFTLHLDKLPGTVDFVMETIRENYPDLNIPFHSRWGHFRAGKIDREKELDRRLSGMDALEKARVKLDLVITSVLLDAGAGPAWKYLEKDSKRTFDRSEGLGVASFHWFLTGAMSGDGSLRADAQGLSKLTTQALEEAFQVTSFNPLVGVTGRLSLLNNLARALGNKKLFKDARPGNLVDLMLERHGKNLQARQLLRGVLDGLGPIWPGRLTLNGVNLGDVWEHPQFGKVAFHKLSQWMTYSLIEPLMEAGFQVENLDQMTGLPEYRNGGLFIDAGVIQLKDPSLAGQGHAPGDPLIIEWRALTVALLDQVGELVRGKLGKTSAEFPLAKVLEGGTWWAGRRIAAKLRPSGPPPLNIVSDGTVF